jgi:hypothetical protein
MRNFRTKHKKTSAETSEPSVKREESEEPATPREFQ